MRVLTLSGSRPHEYARGRHFAGWQRPYSRPSSCQLLAAQLFKRPRPIRRAGDHRRCHSHSLARTHAATPAASRLPKDTDIRGIGSACGSMVAATPAATPKALRSSSIPRRFP